MTTITFSTGNPMGFYSQSLQEKLFPILGNGETLRLNEIFQLLIVAGSAPLECLESSANSCQMWALMPEDYSFCGFDEESDEFLGCELNVDEWIAFTRWLSELAEIRSLDYKRATRNSIQN